MSFHLRHKISRGRNSRVFSRIMCGDFAVFLNSRVIRGNFARNSAGIIPSSYGISARNTTLRFWHFLDLRTNEIEIEDRLHLTFVNIKHSNHLKENVLLYNTIVPGYRSGRNRSRSTPVCIILSRFLSTTRKERKTERKKERNHKDGLS